MILIKGQSIKLELSDDEGWVNPPESYGIIHDPTGTQLDRCFIYIGPYKETEQPIDLTSDAKKYFGPSYVGKKAIVNVPKTGTWNVVGNVNQILYKRRGKYKAKYFHFFDKKTEVLLTKNGKHFRLELPNNCIVNWRGFVFP